MGPYKARDVAKHIIDLRKDQKDTLTPLQLLKIVYLCHGWMLGKFGRPLVEEEFEAWQYGPVLRDLYSAIKDFGSKPVTKIDNAKDIELDPQEKRLIEVVTNFYAKYDGLRLSALTHAPDSPWDTAWKMAGKNTIMSNDLIENYYSSQVNPNG